MSLRILCALLVALAACRSKSADGAPQATLDYPETRVVDHVDEYHGIKVKDPYRWLEDDNSDETKAWVEAQNKVTFAYLAQIKERARIRERIEKLLDYPKYGVPFEEGGRYFYKKNDGLQNQAVLYVADALDAEPRVLLDPNTLSEDGTVALARQWVSHDGKLMAYAVSDAGSDWRTFRVRDVETGQDLAADVLRWIKFSGASWTADSSGFYYSRYPEQTDGAALTGVNKQQRVYYHAVGTPQSEDPLVYERPDKEGWGLYPFVTEDGRYLVIYVSTAKGGNKNGLFVKDLGADGPIVEVLSDFDANYNPIGNDGSTFWIKTDKDAPKGRIIAIDVEDTAKAWVELVPEAKNSIEDALVVGHHFLIHRLVKAHSKVELYRTDGSLAREIEMPGLGTAFGFTGGADDTETFFGFTGFTFPTTVFRHDLENGETTVFRDPEVDFDPEAFVSKQVAYASADGQYVTMFITHKKGLKLDGSNPTLLHGYGGFGISQTPWFSVSNLVWMEMGGVFAVPNLRGGSEYGEAWHEAGMLEKKQNVFDDFIAAAEALIANRYTSARKLAISGGSNGGLLVGACMNQRPDLFGACLPSVGVMDMLRFHEFTIGSRWVAEYGSSADPGLFPVLLAYSPYHNLDRGTHYPATLVTTGDHDDRVVPAHSFKYAAKLQACQRGGAPVLIRVEIRAGHGAGTPTSKRIEQIADRFAFLVRNLRIKLPRGFG